MTRFLPRIWLDPRCGSSNTETESLFAYHDATKHTYRSVRAGARSLDWANQPDPFRAYEGAPLIALPPEPHFPAVGTFATMAALGEVGIPGQNGAHRIAPQLDLDWLSSFLWHSVAISAWKKIPTNGARYSLRVNPSSGNLHPTETYVALRGFTGVDDGLYHYRADRHELELRGRGAWTGRLTRELMLPSQPEPQMIVALTSIFWREAWKYGERAYRYCCHDLGHAMMSVLLSAQALGLSGGAVAHFSDLRLARALGLADSDEAPMAFLVFPSQTDSGKSALPVNSALLGTPNQLSAEEIQHELLLGMHRSTVLPDPPGPLPRSGRANPAAGTHPPRSSAVRDSPLGPVVRRRRSALDFDHRTPPMERGDVEQLLDFATMGWRADWRGNFSGAAPEQTGADLVTLYLYLHRVRDCAPGVYRWDRANRTLEELHRSNVERVAAYLSLEQSLAGNSCFTVSMIADLGEAARIFGNRGYRYAYFEAGAIGQRLYVGAEALGWNSTGIGAFYDDDVHRYLGLLEEAENPVDTSMRGAERSSLVMLDSPAGRAPLSGQDDAAASGGHPQRAKEGEPASPKDPRTLPRQVIYHFAVGRAIIDQRLEG